MQGKVSMVIPCYNKVDYIGEMFDSIIAQNWDNIELILVNDGSSDGTRDIIAEYESRFTTRGYTVFVIDQENQGVCAAAKTGLSHVTGDYICLVDADDELSPVYVSVMAGWLEHEHECDYCVCGAIHYTGSAENKVFETDWALGRHASSDYLVEKYIISEIRTTPWIYMLRASYFHKCSIVKTYYTETKGSHEPSYIIPILSYGGKYKYLPLPLYHFNCNDESHSRSKCYGYIKQYNEEYYRLCKIAIDSLPDGIADNKRKRYLIGISFISACIRTYRFAATLAEESKYKRESLELLLPFVNRFYKFKRPITQEQTVGYEEMLFTGLIKAITGTLDNGNERSKCKGRVIGYGAMGKNASWLLPQVKGTELEPTELWDRNGDGYSIQKPCFKTVNEEDTVIVFPKGEVYDEVAGYLRGTGCVIMGSEDIVIALEEPTTRFPQLRSMNII